MFSSPIFHIDKTFRAEISLFLGMKHFLFQPGIEPAPTSTWATRYSVRALNQLRYRGTHESLAQVIEVLSLHVLLVVPILRIEASVYYNSLAILPPLQYRKLLQCPRIYLCWLQNVSEIFVNTSLTLTLY